MRQRNILLDDVTGPVCERRLSFEDRLNEHDKLAERLRLVTLQWRDGLRAADLCSRSG